MNTITNNQSIVVLDNLIKVIQENKQYLSDIDGAIGDGDHGINMNKGFSMCREELDKNPGDLAHGFKTLSKVLMMKIGGSMGPLYGKFFQAMAKELDGKSEIGAVEMRAMFNQALASIQSISPAVQGDKTLMDCLIPAVEALNTRLDNGNDLSIALGEMKIAAEKGRDATIDMMAKLGRASRLGERSRGVMDAGAASCCLIICSIADSFLELYK
jgi:phosphoenolpyruvate---glycerone phosphotransferase subunit DhaL